VLNRNATMVVRATLRTRRVIGEAEARRRRRRNRENMRQKRADPVYRALERQRREGNWRRSAEGVSFESRCAGSSQLSESLGRCAICRMRNAVEVITRLRPSADAKTGYVQMRVAYCGFC
jgi:hypothetical protein